MSIKWGPNISQRPPSIVHPQNSTEKSNWTPQRPVNAEIPKLIGNKLANILHTSKVFLLDILRVFLDFCIAGAGVWLRETSVANVPFPVFLMESCPI